MALADDVSWKIIEDGDGEALEDGKLVLHKIYFYESYFKLPVHDIEVVLCSRKISA